MVTRLKQKQRSEGPVEKSVSENFANFTGNYLFWSLLLIKLQAIRLEFLKKRDADGGVFCEICKKILSTYFQKHLPSDNSLKRKK